jgi:apolipoprotein N-acyltransferase
MLKMMPARRSRPLGNNPEPGIVLRVFCGSAFVVLTWLSFPNMFFREGCPALGWVALVPFFVLLEGLSFCRRLLWGALCSLAIFLLLTIWMTDISLWAWMLLSLVLATGPFMFAAFSGLAPVSPAGQAIFWPSLWVVSEFVRSFALGGFTWSYVYSQSQFPALIWSAAWGGVYLPLWILVFVNSAFYLFLSFRRIMWVAVATALFLLNLSIGLLILSRPSLGESFWRVALIQPNISRLEKATSGLYEHNARRHLALSREAVARSHPQLIVWPETAFPDDILADVSWRERLESFAGMHRSSMLIGSALLDDGRDLNSALLLSDKGSWSGAYFKRKLVPLSEFIPVWWPKGIRAFPQEGSGHNFFPGVGRGLLGLDHSGLSGHRRRTMFGVALCSEEAYPELFRDLSGHGAAFIVVMLNDGWFQSKSALAMHAQNAVFRSLESGVPILRAANTGRTVAFDAYGRPLNGDFPLDQRAGWVVVNVPLARRLTMYAQYGDIFVWICMGFVIIAACLRKCPR